MGSRWFTFSIRANKIVMFAVQCISCNIFIFCAKKAKINASYNP